MPQVQVTSTLYVQKGQLERALQLAQEHVLRSRSEDGCLRHEVYQSPSDPHVLFFYERWRDPEALHRHFEVRDSVAFVREIAALLDDPPELQVCSVENEQTRTIG